MAETIVQYVGYALSIIFAIITALSTVMQKKSAAKKIEESAKIADKIRAYMEEAEKFTAYSAGEKLNYVVTRLIQYCQEAKISYHETEVIEQVEKEIELSKSVNAKECKDGTGNQPTTRTDIQ